MTDWYITSDLHLFHRNIIKGVSTWDNASSTRDFEDTYEMNRVIIENINKTVGKEDTLWILGDIAFSKSHSEWRWIKNSIICDNIFVVLGNHDNYIRKYKADITRFKEIHDYGCEINYRYPLDGTDPNHDPWKGSQRMVLSHYAMRVWNQSHRGAWMLYGHSHTSLDIMVGDMRDEINSFYLSKKTMDIGIDNAYRFLGEYRPFSFRELKDIMDDKDRLFIDHHKKEP